MASHTVDGPQHDATSKEKTRVTLSLDVWLLVFAQVDKSRDLCNVCLTSRAWNALATPILYRSIPLMPQDISVFERVRNPGSELRHSRSLAARLRDPKNDRLRSAVRELEFRFHRDKPAAQEKLLIGIVSRLPNLRLLKLRSAVSQGTLRQLVRRKNLELHLLAENGKRRFEGDMPNIAVLEAEVLPSDEGNGPNRDILGVQKLLFGCPDLKSFSLGMRGDYGGCMIYSYRYERVANFQFSGDEVFPPLEELTLSGYGFLDEERKHWRERLQWSKLKTVTLGPRRQADFLELAQGYATALQNLTVQVYTDADFKTKCPELEEFLQSFDSLESLTVKGYIIPLTHVIHHPGLKHLCLHIFGRRNAKKPRHTYGVEELQTLDDTCPLLETLELDLNRDGEWPEQLLKTIATGFRNLRKLTLHLELAFEGGQCRNERGEVDYLPRVEPVLTADSAREIGKRFFAWRGPSNLSVLVLWTGEPLRRYPQREPPFVCFERRNSSRVEVHKPRNPDDEPEVVVLPKHFSDFY